MMMVIAGIVPLVIALWWMFQHDEDTHSMAIGIVSVVVLVCCVILIATGMGQIMRGTP